MSYKNIKLIFNYVIGPLIGTVLILSIYRQLLRQPDWRSSWVHLQQAFSGESLLLLAAVAGLMLLNWGIEARKWQLVIRHLEPLSWLSAFQAVLAGTTLAFFTPNRTGEYFGRVLYLPPGERLQAVPLTLVTSLSQIIVTFWLGLLGWLMLGASLVQSIGGRSLWMNTLFYGLLGAAIILTLFYFRFSRVMQWGKRFARWETSRRLIGALEGVEPSMLRRLLLLSFLRYLVFILQYGLLFRVFGVMLHPGQVFASVSVLFLVMAVIPTIAVLTELGIRWKASIEIVRLFSDQVLGILATSLSIWLINLVVPALMGSVLMLNLRLFRVRPVQEPRGQPDSK